MKIENGKKKQNYTLSELYIAAIDNGKQQNNRDSQA